MVNLIDSLPSFLTGLTLALATFRSATAVSTTNTFKNTTLHTITSSMPSSTNLAATVTQNCCFLVQDTVHGAWWEQYRTLTSIKNVNFTSYTYYVTPYSNSTITNANARVFATNATFYLTETRGRDPMSTYVNPNPGPYYEGKKLVPTGNITQTVVGGQTINSPAAFYIYSTVKVITAAHVTDSIGSFVCGTQGVVTNAWVTDADAFRTIDNENSNAQSYWGTSKLPDVKYPTTTFTSILTTTYLDYQSSFLVTETYTWEIESYSTSHAPFPTAGVTLTFEKPFVYTPSWAASGATGIGWGDCDGQDKGTVHYGHLPSTLKDYMVGVPHIVSQYPNLASCLIAGPKIATQTVCSGAAPESQKAIGGDLTSSTTITVNPTPDPAASQGSAAQPFSTHNSPDPAPASPVISIIPQSTPQEQTQAPVTSFLAPAHPPTPTDFIPLPIISKPSQGEQYVSSGGQPFVTTAFYTVSYNPESSVDGSTIMIDGQTRIVVAQTVAAPLEIIGRTTWISGTLNVILPASKTLLVDPKILPTTVQAQTMVSDSKTYIVLSTPVTIPIPNVTPQDQAAQILKSIIFISGTPNIVIPASRNIIYNPMLLPTGSEAKTIISGGQAYMFFETPVTMPIPSFSHSTTVISGTLNAIILASQTILFDPSLLPTGVSGSTLVSGSSTYIILDTPVTVPIVHSSPFSIYDIVSKFSLDVTLPSRTTSIVSPTGSPTIIRAATPAATASQKSKARRVEKNSFGFFGTLGAVLLLIAF